MKQAGRKSAAGLAVVAPFPDRLAQPPDDLTAEQAAIWAQIVATKPADWWDAGSLPLLAAYCRAAVESVRVGEMVEATSRRLMDADGQDQLGVYKELRKIQAALSSEMTGLGRQMRLTQQAKYRADAASVASDKAGAKRPWHRVIDA